jgi:hypothetical protein
MILLELFCSVGMRAGYQAFSSTSCQLRYLGLIHLNAYASAGWWQASWLLFRAGASMVSPPPQERRFRQSHPERRTPNAER